MYNSKVTIIMPAYNAANKISKSIDSVISQSYSNWELIIINDSSSDDTVPLIKSYQKNEKRIKLIDLSHNVGVAQARNEGIKEANSKYIAFLDSDDYWTSDKLTKQINFMEENNYSFTYSDFYVVNSAEKILGKRVAQRSITYSDLLKSNQIGCLTVVLDANLVKDNLMKDIGHEDYLTWLKILKNNITAYNVGETLAYYRVSDSSLSSNKLEAAKWQWNIYRNELNISFVKSSFYFINYFIHALRKHFFSLSK